MVVADRTGLLSPNRFTRQTASLTVQRTFMSKGCCVYKRHNLDEFLVRLFGKYKVGFYTTSSADYARVILENILAPNQAPEFIFDRNQCTTSKTIEYSGIFSSGGGEELSKDIGLVCQLGFLVDNIIVVDDKPDVWTHPGGHVLEIPPFLGEIADNELSVALGHINRANDSDSEK